MWYFSSIIFNVFTLTGVARYSKTYTSGGPGLNKRLLKPYRGTKCFKYKVRKRSPRGYGTLTAPWFSPKLPLFPELPPPNLSTAPYPPLLLCWQTSESLSVEFSLLSRIFSNFKGEHLRAEMQENQLIGFFQSICMHQHWSSKIVLVVKYWRPWVKKIRGPRGNCRCAHSSRVPY